MKIEAEKSEDSSGSAGLSSLHRTYSQDCSFKNSMYHVGDYVYVEPAEANLQPHIVCIERLWEDSAGKDAFGIERQAVKLLTSSNLSPVCVDVNYCIRKIMCGLMSIVDFF